MRKLLAAVLFSLSLAGCQSTDDAAAGEVMFVNKTCPIMEGAAIDPNGDTLSVGSQTVGFCCHGCKEEFEGWTPAEQQEYLQGLSGQ